MIKQKYIKCLIILGVMAFGCKKPYNPSVISDANNYLVVEGVINTANDLTVIKLSRTVKLNENVKTSAVADYTVAIQDEAGNNINLQYAGNGSYSSGSPLNLDQSKKYRLHITHNADEYASDYVAIKPNPAIDSVGFITRGNNLDLYVNTHSPANDTRYYRWEFEETWKFHAKFESRLIVDKVTKEIRGRTPDEFTYFCYGSDSSSNTLIASSAKLSQDVIFQAPLISIPSTAEKLEIRYSILVKQYALTKEAFQFWENIKKNTEQLGSIFDAQPSQLMGNIRCISNPAEPVIGYLSATNVQQKRIYVNNDQLPPAWFTTYPYYCTIDSAFFSAPPTGLNTVKEYIIDGDRVAINPISLQTALIGYTYSSPECTDCRLRGKVQQPAFWKEK